MLLGLSVSGRCACVCVSCHAKEKIKLLQRFLIQEARVASGDRQPNESEPKHPDTPPRGVVLVLDMEGVSLTETGGSAQAVRCITKCYSAGMPDVCLPV